MFSMQVNIPGIKNPSTEIEKLKFDLCLGRIGE